MMFDVDDLNGAYWISQNQTKTMLDISGAGVVNRLSFWLEQRDPTTGLELTIIIDGVSYIPPSVYSFRGNDGTQDILTSFVFTKTLKITCKNKNTNSQYRCFIAMDYDLF